MATLRDIAARAKVSVVTVHKCIYGKPGVGQETRRRVMGIVEEENYTIPLAATHQRGPLRLAVICPDTPAVENPFFGDIQAGAAQAAKELAEKRVDVRMYLCRPDWEAQIEILQELERQEGLHGVATYCMDDRKLNDSFAALKEKGIPVVTFNTDAPDSCRVACVTPPSKHMGALAAELLYKMDRSHRRLLIVGGEKRLSNVRENTTGFYNFIQQHCPEVSLLEINNASHRDTMKEVSKVLTLLNDVTGIYCSMTRNSVQMCEILNEQGLQHKIKLVCTDVFLKLKPYMDDGTVDATIWQDPRAQCRNAVRLLYRYLTKGRIGPEDCRINICPVMQSNFTDYLYLRE